MKEEIKKFKLSRGDKKIKVAWSIIKKIAKYSHAEPYWDFLKENFGIREKDIKEIMRFLEESGELEIHRSVDGKRLYVSTLKDIKENPVKLDRWLK
ncbi:hypothetical protein DRN34_01930 [Thermococci archaeon]|nr:MAG: hypothetical protein DRN32_06585 [Thermococci archaeon]RLF87419.1 MAG: hypothetical protein DRN34_01930 [Thermococci archaeon]